MGRYNIFYMPEIDVETFTMTNDICKTLDLLLSEKLSRVLKPHVRNNLSLVTLHDTLPIKDLVDIVQGLLEMIANEPCDILALSKIGFEPNLTNRAEVLELMGTLATELDALTVKYYLAKFCNGISVPLDFMGDQTIQDSINMLKQKQEAFKLLHEQFEQLKDIETDSEKHKHAIQKMEDEKQLVTTKLERLNAKIKDIPNSDVWIVVARDLRTEQQSEENLAIQERELRLQLQIAQEKLDSFRKFSVTSNDPAILLDKLRREVDLAKSRVDQGPKDIRSLQQEIQLMQEIICGNGIPTSEIVKLEQEIEFLGEEIKDYENRQDYKSCLFPEKPKLGDDIKKFVLDLRTKTNVFKAKKADYNSMIQEESVLLHTREVLEKKKTILARNLQAFEQRYGISGYTETKTQLTKLSEHKSTIEDNKEEKMHQYTELVNNTINLISSKKATLEPIIIELKTLRQKAAAAEQEISDIRSQFDNSHKQLIKETEELGKIIEELDVNRENLETEIYKTNLMIQMAEADNEVFDSKDHNQWLKFYEAETGNTIVRFNALQQQDLNLESNKEYRMKQQEYFRELFRIMQLKIEHNESILAFKETKAIEIVGITEQRLVL